LFSPLISSSPRFLFRVGSLAFDSSMYFFLFRRQACSTLWFSSSQCFLFKTLVYPAFWVFSAPSLPLAGSFGFTNAKL
jgi:hypothetical protein